MTTVVSIKSVIPHTDNFHKRDIYKMRDVLVKQGQIEPLQVAVYSRDMDGVPTYITFQEDYYGPRIIAAAKYLEWDTLLIVVMERYEQ